MPMDSSCFLIDTEEYQGQRLNVNTLRRRLTAQACHHAMMGHCMQLHMGLL